MRSKVFVQAPSLSGDFTLIVAIVLIASKIFKESRFFARP